MKPSAPVINTCILRSPLLKAFFLRGNSRKLNTKPSVLLSADEGNRFTVKQQPMLLYLLCKICCNSSQSSRMKRIFVESLVSAWYSGQEQKKEEVSRCIASDTWIFIEKRISLSNTSSLLSGIILVIQVTHNRWYLITRHWKLQRKWQGSTWHM